MNKYLFAMAGAIMLTACTDRIQELENSCNANNGNDCLELAHIYESGKEVQQDNLKAMEFYKKTCNAGDVSICQLVAKTYFKGENGIQQNNAEGTLYSEKACDLGHVQSCYNVAQSYEKGTTSETNITKSISYYEKACKLGDSSSCGSASVMFFIDKNNLDKDPKRIQEMAKLAHKGCELNDGAACFVVGILFETVGNEPQAAMHTLKKSCVLNYEAGCKALIALIKQHEGNIWMSIDARDAFDKLCDMGNGPECATLASYYGLDTVLGKKDLNKAISSYIKGCALKVAGACFGAGNLYDEIKDEEKAKTFYKKACDLGLQAACEELTRTSKWSEINYKDDFTGNTNISFSLESKESLHVGYGKEISPQLRARCKDNETEVYIDFDTVMTCGDSMKIGLKFDDQQPYYEYWTGSTDCKALFSRQPIKFLKKMVGKKELMVRFTPHGSGDRNVTFNISGNEEVTEKLSNACHWKK